MAFLQCNYHSDVLGRAASMNVLVPQQSTTQIGMANACTGRKTYPVLYLLHGLSDDHTIWMRRTSIERYAAEYEVVIVMPDGERGFYTDMAAGYNYWTMLSEELPAVVASLFPVSARREDTFAAGLSMGGYGALKLALRHPERFAAAASLSAVTDIPAWYHRNLQTLQEVRLIFGEEKDIVPRGNDLFALAEGVSRLPEPPRILQVCGTEDMLYEDNIRFHRHLAGLGMRGHQFIEAPGTHDWAFWDTWIQTALRFLLKGGAN